MTIKVLMVPHLDDIQPLPTNGISAVVKKYFEYLPQHGIEMLPPGSEDANIVAIHAGATRSLPAKIPLVSHNHGLYWTADQEMDVWTHRVNETVINIARRAHALTVPSEWVAKVFRRDMHLNPAVIPHGVEWQDWQEGVEDNGYVLWNKNRSSDACDPTPVNRLAERAPKMLFLTTYAAPNPRPNIKVTGTVDHLTMRDMILKCGIYLATTKETFGIGTLEAMSAGKPILGFDWGGTADLVRHGYNGYLARPGDYDDLLLGLEYCQQHKESLGYHSRQMAQHYGWDSAVKMVAQQYALTAQDATLDSGSIAVVIPCYNKAGTVLRAIRSAINQVRKPNCIYVINNNSTDDFVPQIEIAQKEADEANVQFIFTNCSDQGVAHARNLGISLGGETFICCLDADDEMMPEFLDKCHRELLWDRSLGIVYTGMEVVNQEGGITTSQWPGEYNFDMVLKGRNQVPTCCLFRREAWQRAGGYRQRYAPGGAGSEDADLWLRIGLLGYGGKRAVAYPLFRYYLGGIVSGNPEYREKDWRGDKGWLASGEYPLAATFTPVNGLSHLVRQYDEPEIAVIIPCSRKHIDLVVDAIDSVESQTYRKWELIVVADGHTRQDADKWDRLQKAYPFVKWQTTYAQYRGAGAARNLGAELAKAPLLLFLDADDFLVPMALQEMMQAHREFPEGIIYSDYLGHAFIQDKVILGRLNGAGRLIDYDAKTTKAVVLYHAFDYDCIRAQAQPIMGQDPYIWNVVTSLVPRQYHIDIGGFDVDMESWEDYDYFVRLAKAGKCFHRIAQPLLEYRFYTGERRSLANPGESGDSGRQLSTRLLQYMQHKYEGIENMPCSSCRGPRTSLPPAPILAKSLNEGKMSNMSSTDMVKVELIDGNIGDHLIAFQGESYGYRIHGDQFNMKREHAQLDRRVRVITDSPVQMQAARPMPPPPPAAPMQQMMAPPVDDLEPLNRPPMTLGRIAAMQTPVAVPTKAEGSLPNAGPPAYDLTKVWGVNEERAELLRGKGVRTLDGLIVFGPKKIAELFGIPELNARRVVSEADKLKEADSMPRGRGRPAKKK